ncbi:hypothetical protein F7984_12610 [Pradoshia sp. D12]|uniref:hypothetical protein n=1 Tax=Bacillaceae TaxID=186817 RepID=UPI00080AE3CC|nr:MULTISPECIES: hypothetical protein [Bacillaceae]OCA86214.1 hypothetical protein A8L44_07310 [Bacillus sp. FJAT-27986]QFK72010.1 hypothetical protein F7984_12610 [Pradoshia sp. D12]TPF71498.1 hypothetical protein FHY44_13590 [Bacillus sp. D12]
MNSIMKNIISLFFEKAEHPVKPLMYAQITVWIGMGIASFPVLYTSRFYWMYLMLGTSFLLNGIENYLVKETNRRGYLIWFICALLFYLIAAEDYFFI